MSDDSVTMLATLKRVPYLAPVDEPTLARLAERGRRARYAPRSCLVAELESGADVFVILSGQAEVTVDARGGGGQKVLQTLGPGDAFGEMSSLTGELRSATVTAVTAVEVLVIADAEFDKLREQRPLVARALGRDLAQRLLGAEEMLAQLLVAKDPASLPASATRGRRGSIRRAFDELVVNKKRDLAFLSLTAFIFTLVLVRMTVYLSFRLDFAVRDILRAAYMSGFLLLVGSACASLLTFRQDLRRLIAFAYGVGVALIVNELGVTLAFDIFYKNIHTADPNAPFDIERLYRRTEAPRAIVIALLVLIQAAYLRRFYGRVLFVVQTRLRKLL